MLQISLVELKKDLKILGLVLKLVVFLVSLKVKVLQEVLLKHRMEKTMMLVKLDAN